MICAVYYDSPIARFLLAEQEGNLIGLWMMGQKYYPKLDNLIWQDTPVLKQTARWLDRYFSGQQPDIGELPLAPEGSAFRQDVWKILCRIPYGKTTTYGEIAKELARERGLDGMSAQAVGGAVGHNPISVIIPCHRVVGSDGSMTGYAGGVERKRWLLEYEQKTI